MTTHIIGSMCGDVVICSPEQSSYPVPRHFDRESLFPIRFLPSIELPTYLLHDTDPHVLHYITFFYGMFWIWRHLHLLDCALVAYASNAYFIHILWWLVPAVSHLGYLNHSLNMRDINDILYEWLKHLHVISLSLKFHFTWYKRLYLLRWSLYIHFLGILHNWT